MRNSNKIATIEAKIAQRTFKYTLQSREILMEMVRKYIGEKYTSFASKDMIVLLEDYIDAHSEAYEVCEALDKVKVNEKIISELGDLKFEIQNL